MYRLKEDPLGGALCSLDGVTGQGHSDTRYRRESQPPTKTHKDKDKDKDKDKYSNSSKRSKRKSPTHIGRQKDIPITYYTKTTIPKTKPFTQPTKYK